VSNDVALAISTVNGTAITGWQADDDSAYRTLRSRMEPAAKPALRTPAPVRISREDVLLAGD